jgi:dynactin complex subunit
MTLRKNWSASASTAHLSHPIVSAEVKAGLKEVLRAAAKLAETTNQLANVDRQLDELTKDQARLRSNLQIVPQSSEHYKKFLEKFVAQETGIENLQQQNRQLLTTLKDRQRAYQAFVTTLNAE